MSYTPLTLMAQIQGLPQLKNYKIDFPIGQGSSALVYHAQDIKNCRNVAIKVIDRSIFTDSASLVNIEKELRIYERIDHPHIAKFYETIFTQQFIFIVMEFLANGTLKETLSVTTNFIPHVTVIRWAKEILEALVYLHERGIAHRDLKPENIGFDSLMQAKLIDFGFSTESKDSRCSTPCGTLSFVAPEIVAGGPYNAKKADIWSFGMTIYDLLSNNVAVPSASPRKYLEHAKEFVQHIHQNYKGEYYRLLSRSLTFNPCERADAKELLNDPLFLNAEDISYIHKLKKMNSVQLPKISRKIIVPKRKHSSLDPAHFKPTFIFPTSRAKINTF